MRIIAFLIRMSAAVPWNGAFLAIRSAFEADGEVPLMEARDRAAPAEQRLGTARFAGLLEDAVETRADARELREVRGDEALGLLLRYAELTGEREGTHAVEDSEVDGLGAAPHVGRDEVGVDAEDLRGRGAVDVLTLLEHVDERLVAREVREEPQLDLRVVGRRAAGRLRGATKARRISCPRSVRMGMFWRFGSFDESRPVAATAWS